MKGSKRRGKHCPYCHLSLFFCMVEKKWYCPKCGDVALETKTVEVSDYR